MFKFTPYYEPSPPLWEVLANIMSSFWKFRNWQKVYNYVEVLSLLSAGPLNNFDHDFLPAYYLTSPTPTE